MRVVFKYICFGINLLLVLVFLGIYLYYIHPIFLLGWNAIGFIILLLIFIEGFAESLISCIFADETSCRCWISQFLLTVAIASLYFTAYMLMDEFMQIIAVGELGAIVAGIFYLLFIVLASPMLISKYSSWLLLGISMLGDYESKYELLFPLTLIIINIVATIIMRYMEMTMGWAITYYCVFGGLSIVSMVLTLKNADII